MSETTMVNMYRLTIYGWQEFSSIEINETEINAVEKAIWEHAESISHKLAGAWRGVHKGDIAIFDTEQDAIPFVRYKIACEDESGDAIREGDMVEFICDVTSAMIYDDGNHGKVIISRGEIWRYLHTKTDTWPAKEGRTMFVKFSTHTWHVKPEWVKKA